MITKEEAQKAYQELIQLRRSEVLVKSNENPGKIEIHHIIPISCNGEDVDENKIALYAKEHFMAHVYLWIIHHNDEFHNQTLCALNKMIQGTLNGNRQELRDFILASEEYQKAREEFAQYSSKLLSEANTGLNSHSYGKHWYYDPITLSCNQFFDNEVPEGFILGRKFKNPEKFSQRVSECAKNTIWIRKIDLTEQKRVKQELALSLIETGLWEYGHLSYTDEQREQQRRKTFETQLKNGTQSQKIYIERKLYPICLNCGKDNPNKFTKCCCNTCKFEYNQKIAKEFLVQKHLKEAEKLNQRGYFDCQTTELYKGIVNRKQVKRYLEAIGQYCCNKCGCNDIKLICHAIDGNCRNLSINNYEFLCKECYHNFKII